MGRLKRPTFPLEKGGGRGSGPLTRGEGRVRHLHALSRQGVWGLLIFLILSVAVLQDYSFLPPLPDKIQHLLGPAPPVGLISTVLVIYSFSALLLILSRMWSGTGNYRGWSHLGYLSAFYGFYGFSRAIEENFLAVFVAGMTILALEYYHVRTYCNEALAREKETAGGNGEAASED